MTRIRLGLHRLGAQLIEDRERRLGVALGVVVALPRDVHFGVVHETQAL